MNDGIPSETTIIAAQPSLETCQKLLVLARSLPFDRVRVAVAYATEQGVNLLLSSMSAEPRWESATKMFLIGIDQGFTQPAALKRLATLLHSSVRIPGANEVLESANLHRKSIFHPKAYCFDSGSATIPFGLLIGSANLSVAGLTQNTELSLAYTGFRKTAQSWSDVFHPFNRWWNQQWNRAEQLNEALLARYSYLLEDIRRSSPTRFLAEEPSPSDLTSAQSVWIESGFLSGGSHNQLELPQGVENFFGAPVPGPGAEIILRLHHGSNSWDSWLKFWGNQVWRLRLPTPAQGLTSCENTILRFNRNPKGGTFELVIAHPASREASDWEANSIALGTLRETIHRQGGRRYGWF
jgi:HKD family nuclease